MSNQKIGQTCPSLECRSLMAIRKNGVVRYTVRVYSFYIYAMLILVAAYRDIYRASVSLARYYVAQASLGARGPDDGTNEMTVALLCPRSIDFMMNLFALMRMGYSVLLVA